MRDANCGCSSIQRSSSASNSSSSMNAPPLPLLALDLWRVGLETREGQNFLTCIPPVIEHRAGTVGGNKSREHVEPPQPGQLFDVRFHHFGGSTRLAFLTSSCPCSVEAT